MKTKEAGLFGFFASAAAGAITQALQSAAGKVSQGLLRGKGGRFAIVVSRFNLFVTHKLLLGAIDGLRRCGVDKKDIEIFWTPGAFEIPQAALKVARRQKARRPDAILCLGAVIRGQTPHFDYICQEAARGISSVSFQENLPVVFGVLTTDDLKQALARAGGAKGNKGWDSALAAVEMVNLFKLI